MSKLDPQRFDIANGKVLGAGAISFVVRATEKNAKEPKQDYAIKILSKIQLLQQGKVESVMKEKDTYYKTGPHPFIGRLHGTMQSEDELYFVMEELPHGDLLEHIRRINKQKKHLKENGCMTVGDTKFVTAQILCALKRCIEAGYSLRDLKPENICFDKQYRAVMIDFDTVDNDPQYSKPFSNDGIPVKPVDPTAPKPRKSISEIQATRKQSAAFCGTAQYVSPEMVGQCRWSYASDLWALGCIVYQCMYGYAPFDGENPFECMKQIIKGTECRSDFFSPLKNVDEDSFTLFKQFVTDLLNVDPTKRLGVSSTLDFDFGALKNHSFLRDVDWELLEKEVSDFSYTNPFTNETTGSTESTSTCFKTLYSDVPEHSNEYAEYAYKTGGENVFERFAEAALDGAEVSTTEVAVESPNTAPQPSDGSDADEEDDVIDDVGQRDHYAAYQFAAHRAASNE